VPRQKVEQRVELRFAHGEQADQHRDEAGGVDCERPACAPRGDDDARQRGPEDTRDVEQARVERDRVRQLVASDHLERQVLTRRRIEDECCACESGDRVDLPQLQLAEQGDRCKHGGEEHLDGLGREHHSAVVEAVGDDPGEEAEQGERPEAADRQ
jgi:hypothetical protein